MDYQKIYNQLIKRAVDESRKKVKNGVYYELHHIIPKCLGGQDTQSNLVLLTAREHLLAHWLLALIHNNYKLWCAFYMMCNGAKNNKVERPKVSLRVLAMAKEEYSKKSSEFWKKQPYSQKAIDACREANLGSKRDPKLVEALRQTRIGVKPSEKCIAAVKLANTGAKRPKSEQEMLNRQKYYELQKKKVYQYDFKFNLLNTFESLTEAKLKTNLTGISEVCLHKQIISGNFVFSFKILKEEDKPFYIERFKKLVKNNNQFMQKYKQELLNAISIFEDNIKN